MPGGSQNLSITASWHRDRASAAHSMLPRNTTASAMNALRGACVNAVVGVEIGVRLAATNGVIRTVAYWATGDDLAYAC